jgi:uncharacterized protein (TIGR02646 family)
MRRCERGPAPELLARDGAELARRYVTNRLTNPAYRFQWGASRLGVVREALERMTDERCSYCDGYPIAATGEESVDHFRPKSRAEFYELVCTWTNLFLTCTACNKAKQDQWDEALLCPDDSSYAFERYFEYRFDTGELQPSASASPDDQTRASRTIEIFDLNRAGACISRRRTVKRLRGRTSDSDDDLDDLDYRYLLPLCPVKSA